MTGAPRAATTWLAVVIGLVPFAFATVRFAATASDLRYLWMAIVAAVASAAVMAAGRARARNRAAQLRLGGAAIVVATLMAAWTASLLGARAASGVWMVAGAFGICSGASQALFVGTRSGTD